MSFTMLTTNAYILLCVSVHNTGQNTHLHNNINDNANYNDNCNVNDNDNYNSDDATTFL